MTRKFRKIWLCITIIFCVLCILGKEQRVYAAKSGLTHLGTWGLGDKAKTFKKYDVTGDGKEDTVKISVKWNSNRNDAVLKIFVNDKLAFKSKAVDCIYWSVDLVQLKNGKVFFELLSLVSSDDVDIHGLYQYDNGKIKSCYDFLEFYSEYAHNFNMNLYKVKGNTLYTVVSGQFYATGAIGHKMKLVYKKGKFQRESNSYPILYNSQKNNKWTAKRKVKVYKKPGSKTITYTLKKGNVVKINQMVYKNNKMYFKIKNKNGKGKTGYIPVEKADKAKTYFKEAYFSG